MSEENCKRTFIGKIKKRSKPWGEVEEVTLIKEVLEREEVLFGGLKGCGAKSIHQHGNSALKVGSKSRMS